jgi:hypothetical protein
VVKHERKPLAASKKVKLDDTKTPHIDDKKLKWIFFTNCKDHSTYEKGVYNLIHWDSEHKDGFKKKRPQCNLTMVETYVPMGPPLATARELMRMNDDIH